MPATDLDHHWFKVNPSREYRQRRETPAEIAGWEVPPRPGFAAWCIIRRSDSASVSYAFPSDATWDVADEELAALFERLNEDKA
ncbi:hypothetical protein MKK68_25080 [Methylobacterium sp. E-016]|uniref:hypothetical protein n=1 Tax=Methylobacterium sp. E-016 TaxID=2836556 RepID=UPI001FB9123E|nr:hypothetical protein [Methylobacterium sp. E-016]MCJ2078870.1 hypothetical protein [Methylobacterium sp. E-016]